MYITAEVKKKREYGLGCGLDWMPATVFILVVHSHSTWEHIPVRESEPLQINYATAFTIYGRKMFLFSQKGIWTFFSFLQSQEFASTLHGCAWCAFLGTLHCWITFMFCPLCTMCYPPLPGLHWQDSFRWPELVIFELHWMHCISQFPDRVPGDM